MDEATNATLRDLAEKNTAIGNDITRMTPKLKFASKDEKVIPEWMKNVHELSKNIDLQKRMGRVLSESFRVEEEEQGQSLRDKYLFLIEKLKSSIFYFANCLQEFVETPDQASWSRQRVTWDVYVAEVEMELKKVSASIEVINDQECIVSLTALTSLLALRDSLLTKMLRAALYTKAVLDWDLRSKREYADRCLVECHDLVMNLYQAKSVVPNMLQEPIERPTPPTDGPYTTKEKIVHAGHVEYLDQFTATFLATIREFRHLEKALRAHHFGTSLVIKGDDDAVLSVPGDSLRDEVCHWYKKCQAMEYELQVLKAARHTAWSAQVDALRQKLDSKEDTLRHVTRKKNALETEVMRLTNERQDQTQKFKEANERYLRIQTQTVPRLDRLEELTEKSSSLVALLQADAEQLSAMFRKQLEANVVQDDQVEGKVKEINNLQEVLKIERRNLEYAKLETVKKEKLVIRAMAARETIQQAYTALKDEIRKHENSAAAHVRKQKELETEIEALQMKCMATTNELARAMARVDELEAQNLVLTTRLHENLGSSVSAPQAPALHKISSLSS